MFIIIDKNRKSYIDYNINRINIKRKKNNCPFTYNWAFYELYHVQSNDLFLI